MIRRLARAAAAATALGLAALAAPAYVPAAGTWNASGTETATATLLGNTNRSTAVVAFDVAFDEAGAWSLPVADFGVTLTGTTDDLRGNRFRLVADEASAAALAVAMEAYIRNAAPQVESVAVRPPKFRGKAIPGEAGDVLSMKMTLRARAMVRLYGRLYPMGIRMKGLYEAAPAF